MNVINILTELRETNSSNDKIEILRKNKDNAIFKEVLLWCYDQNINFYITNFNDSLNTGIKTIDTDWNIIKNLYEILSTRKCTGNTARNLVKETLDLFDNDTQNIVLSTFKRDLRCNVGTGLINKVYGKDFLSEFSVQLAKAYDENRNYKTDYWWVTPKLDGIRCFWKSDTPDILWSRNGKEHKGFSHILNAIHKIYAQYPNISFIDGELFTENMDFNSIQGAVTSTVNFDINDKEKMNLNIFAIGNNDWQNTEDMQKFIEILNNIYNKTICLRFIIAKKIENSPEVIKDFARKYVEEGYEGCVLRSIDTYYEFKRGHNLVKFKFFKESDLTIIDMIEGTGKYEGKLGAIICEGIIDGKIVNTECGTGFSDELRQYFWDNKNLIINKLAEIKYQEMSQASNGKYSLRFPVFRKLKQDR